MTKNDVVVRTLARGLVASTLTVALPQNHTAIAVMTLATAGESSATIGRVAAHSLANSEASRENLVIPTVAPTTEWTQSLEREFRALALKEAKGILKSAQAPRLEQLTHLRDQLLSPPSADEILLQIRRDRLLSRMKELLDEYVQFERTTNKAWTTSSKAHPTT